jgi:AraC family transcriptional activator of tynA and feaB
MQRVWTTADVPAEKQFSYWRDAVCGAFVPLEPEGRNGRFSGRIESVSGRSMSVSSVTADSHPVNLTRRGVNLQTDTSYFANLLVEGTIFVEQFGVKAKVSAGDIYLLDTSAPFAVEFATPFNILCVTLNETLLRPRLGSGGQAATPLVRGDKGTGRLTAQYIQNILAADPDAALEIEDLAASHLSSLLGRAISGADDRNADETAKRASRNRASLDRIRDFIDAHLADAELNPQSTSDALNMSRSHLYAVMAEAGETFSTYVRNRRLDECRRSISDMPDKTIAEIAYAWGFQDQSSFSRMFKTRFGISPREGRADRI